MLFRLTAATALGLLPLSSRAFYDTAPLLLWSSHPNALTRSLTEQSQSQSRGNINGGVRIETLLKMERMGEEDSDSDSDSDLCTFGALVVFDQPGLHATDLKTLPPTSAVASRLKRALSAVQIPYVPLSWPSSSFPDSDSQDTTLPDTVEEFARRCGAHFQWVSLSLNGGPAEIERGSTERQVLYVRLPEVYGEGRWRRERMAELEEHLNQTLQTIESSFPKHLIIYTGSSSLSPSLKRQLPIDLSSSSSSSGADDTIPTPFAFAPSNSTTTAGGILAHYQLLTPGLILSLLIAFFLLLPAVLLGVRALASIQSPVRLDTPKGPSQSKKNQ